MSQYYYDAGIFSQVRWAKGADVASANALVLGADGNYFDITGTTAITSIGSLRIGTLVCLHFDGILTLTHHATDLILPSGANITTAAGDEAILIEYASGDWRCISYSPASGYAVKQLAASEAVAGVSELATDAETVTGTATDRVTTPANITAKMAAPGAIGGTTPAAGTFTTLSGSMDEIIQASSDTLTAAEVKGSIISNYGQGAADNLQGLPTAAEGMNFIGVCGTAQAANYFRFQAGATDKIYLNGVAGADNGSVSIAVPVVGASIVFYTFQTGAGVYDWGAITVSGLWIAA